MAAPTDRRPLAFILGPSYHGASNLSAKLNAHESILSLGTGNPLRGEDQPCSCGQPVSSCPFWTEVATKIEKAEDDPFDTLLPQTPYLASNKRLNTMLNGGISLLANEAGPKCWSSVYEQAERFLKIQEIYLEAAQELYPFRLYVDAERANLKFMVMSSMGFSVKGCVHLIRDPRGYVAASKKYYPESTLEKLTLEWVAAHTRIKRIKQCFGRVPFLTVRYEDMVTAPAETVAGIITFLGLKADDASTSMSDSRKNHMIGMGAHDMAAEGPQAAENWRESLHPDDQARIIRAAGPLFEEFGFKTANPA